MKHFDNTVVLRLSTVRRPLSQKPIVLHKNILPLDVPLCKNII